MTKQEWVLKTAVHASYACRLEQSLVGIVQFLAIVIRKSSVVILRWFPLSAQRGLILNYGSFSDSRTPLQTMMLVAKGGSGWMGGSVISDSIRDSIYGKV